MAGVADALPRERHRQRWVQEEEKQKGKNQCTMAGKPRSRLAAASVAAPDPPPKTRTRRLRASRQDVWQRMRDLLQPEVEPHVVTEGKTTAKRAGCIFPVARIHRFLKSCGPLPRHDHQVFSCKLVTEVHGSKVSSRRFCRHLHGCCHGVSGSRGAWHHAFISHFLAAMLLRVQWLCQVLELAGNVCADQLCQRVSSCLVGIGSLVLHEVSCIQVQAVFPFRTTISSASRRGTCRLQFAVMRSLRAL